jgi:hypothetical protein
VPESSFVRFSGFLVALVCGEHNLQESGDTLKVYLTNEEPNLDDDYVKTDLAGITEEHGYAAADIQNTLSVNQDGSVILEAVDVVFTASEGSFGPFRYAVIYNDSIDEEGYVDPLIAYFDYGVSITVQNGESFTVDFGDAWMTIGSGAPS